MTRTVLPETTTIARHDYGIGWLALLAEAPPSSDCVLFGIHPSGFAGHMARSPEVTRYYLECPPGDDPENWSHDRVWAELQQRLGADGTPPLTEGRLIEKRVLDMHNYVVEPMTFGRLFLAGDSAHLTAPIAAKGMNLALHDAFLLGDALVAYLGKDDGSGLDGYSEACLRRVGLPGVLAVALRGLPRHVVGRRVPRGHHLRPPPPPVHLACRRRGLRGAVPRYGGHVLTSQSCTGRSLRRWSATFRASSTRRRRCPSRRA